MHCLEPKSEAKQTKHKGGATIKNPSVAVICVILYLQYKCTFIYSFTYLFRSFVLSFVYNGSSDRSEDTLTLSGSGSGISSFFCFYSNKIRALKSKNISDPRTEEKSRLCFVTEKKGTIKQIIFV